MRVNGFWYKNGIGDEYYNGDRKTIKLYLYQSQAKIEAEIPATLIETAELEGIDNVIARINELHAEGQEWRKHNNEDRDWEDRGFQRHNATYKIIDELKQLLPRSKGEQMKKAKIITRTITWEEFVKWQPESGSMKEKFDFVWEKTKESNDE